MRIRLLCVGKPKEQALAGLHDRYADRLRRMGVRYEAEWVPDVKPGGRYSEEHAMEREAGALLQRVDAKTTVVAAHGRGDLLTSDELAGKLQSWSTPGMTLVVGGPLGLHARVLERADHGWSLSPLTFPHELMRVLLAEQLYRAVSILRGTPYHK